MKPCRESRKESRHTERKTETKSKGKWHVGVWISIYFCEFLMFVGSEIDENGVPGLIRDKVGIPHTDPKQT